MAGSEDSRSERLERETSHYACAAGAQIGRLMKNESRQTLNFQLPTSNGPFAAARELGIGRWELIASFS
jgi:hypothetical protein